MKPRGSEGQKRLHGQHCLQKPREETAITNLVAAGGLDGSSRRRDVGCCCFRRCFHHRFTDKFSILAAICSPIQCDISPQSILETRWVGRLVGR